MVQHLRIAVALVFLLLLASSLHSQALKNVKDMKNQEPEASRNLHLYFGFLERAMPIPPSGPSKQHNSVGLQNRRG
ncbi:Protein IDA-LIKE 2 [Dendrobium catenatum]|uniref:Protein IDA-LIKE 2 n=1 Tax=Dendrobium catenatum TaxID=906689 RepID=A0A2I0WN34_9ASPA|nr:Protein IDA-LIKE 2 [Dendrobium catenatum]